MMEEEERPHRVRRSWELKPTADIQQRKPFQRGGLGFRGLDAILVPKEAPSHSMNSWEDSCHFQSIHYLDAVTALVRLSQRT